LKYNSPKLLKFVDIAEMVRGTQDSGILVCLWCEATGSEGQDISTGEVFALTAMIPDNEYPLDEQSQSLSP
jgi:hypothetical protein